MKQIKRIGVMALLFMLLLMWGLLEPMSAVAVSDTTFHGSIVLGRPTTKTVTINITADKTNTVYVEWGSQPGVYVSKSKAISASALKPAEFTMSLKAASPVLYYRVSYKVSGAKKYSSTEEYAVNMPRAAGETFGFAVQSDSHLLNKADKEIYTQSMEAISALDPDFFFDLGDTFLNDKDKTFTGQKYETIRSISYQQRSFFDIVTRRAPLFLTIGNHEGEYGYGLDGTKNNLAAMSTIARKTYYPNPIPNEFYSGNGRTEKVVGKPENYYAFTWGDALFVSIDPYRYTKMDPYKDKDAWGWTLGKTQYDWFRKTLEESTAKYKFVFAHHAIGNMRGAAEVAKLYEWGGYDKNGQYLFDGKRPGWGKPIHQIMKDEGVTIFFQGHDHLFSREMVDGIVYLELPKPAEKIADKQSNYVSYKSGDVLMNSGFLNVQVRPENVLIEYRRNYFVSSEPQEGNTGVVYSFTVDSGGTVEVLKKTVDDLTKYGN